jgi:homoserine O-succinyltransferase
MRLIDWAKDNTISTIWSCLAAHAAVLHLDGVVREKLPSKLAGVYQFERMSDHPLLRGVGAPVPVPHSRLNGLKASDLTSRGYELLTHSDQTGVDAFVKRYQSLFVFLQGHPEYEADSLYREYRRDMTRYLAGRQQTRPSVPENYFDREAIAALSSFEDAARSGKTAALLERFPTIQPGRLSRAGWQVPAARLFANWIRAVAEAKTRQAPVSREHAIV